MPKKVFTETDTIKGVVNSIPKEELEQNLIKTPGYNLSIYSDQRSPDGREQKIILKEQVSDGTMRGYNISLEQEGEQVYIQVMGLFEQGIKDIKNTLIHLLSYSSSDDIVNVSTSDEMQSLGDSTEHNDML